MGRLIDADALVEKLQKDENINLIVDIMISRINNEPTAYDVEKVVHELREATKCNIDCYEGRASEVADYDDSWNDDIISACEAIDIVKRGGVE